MLDTADGALMMALYTSKAFSRDVVAILYYSIVLTGITVFVSAFIGIIQILSLVQHVAEPEGSFWDGVEMIGEYYDVIGGCICGVFILVGVGSVFVYKPWRERMDRRAAQRVADDAAQPPSPQIADPLLVRDESRAPGYGTEV
jgi:high-affinity nickel-transport protein